MTSGVVTSVTVRAPAKVNLQLSVGGRRPDGYHELATAFHAVSLYDEVTATAGPPRHDGLSITVSAEGEQAALIPLDAANLATRAAAALAGRIGIDESVHLHLRKGIPVAGGMAGGSADAAATLIACDALWDAGLTRDELAELAAGVGSDVPFALFGGTAIGTGRGERLSPVLGRAQFHWVLALSPSGLSTPQVYAELDRSRGASVVPEPTVSQELLHALRTGEPARLAAALSNDLQPAACALSAQVRETLDAGIAAGALAGLVSGSGPTVAFLVDGPEHAVRLAEVLQRTPAVSDVRRVHGPVPGARIVEPVRA